jgi:hypothetical protein
VNWFAIVASSVLVVSCMSQAQTKTPVSLLGGKQDILKSEFCKKYKCQPMPRDIGGGYVLELPGDVDWEAINSFKSSKSLNKAQLWSEFRTTFFVKQDRKSEQLILFEFNLRENFKTNWATYAPETVMLADFIYYAVKKRLPLVKSAGEPYSSDIGDCFFNARASPKQNIEELTRVMLTGQIVTQVDSKKVQYRATCSAMREGSTPKMYSPWFTLEIPSMKSDLMTPGDK